MSRQQEDYARLIIEHPEFDGIIELVHRRLFNRFRTATPEQREIINSIVDANDLFFKELKSIADNAEILNEEETEV